jgi:hypothetical protein
MAKHENSFPRNNDQYRPSLHFNDSSHRPGAAGLVVNVLATDSRAGAIDEARPVRDGQGQTLAIPA